MSIKFIYKTGSLYFNIQIIQVTHRPMSINDDLGYGNCRLKITPVVKIALGESHRINHLTKYVNESLTLE